MDPALSTHNIAGSLAARGDEIWIAASDSGTIRVLSVAAADSADPTTDPTADPVATFSGHCPGLVALDDGTFVLVSLDLEDNLVVRRGAAGGTQWSPPIPLVANAAAKVLASGRLTCTSNGILIIPEVRQRDPESATEVVCHVSRDAGFSWIESRPLHLRGAKDPVVAEGRGGRLIMVLRTGEKLSRSVSLDGGLIWSAPTDLGVDCLASPPALGSHAGKLALLWTDPATDSTLAPPRLQALCTACSEDEGRTWHAMRRVVMRPGRVPCAPTLSWTRRGPVLLFQERWGRCRQMVCRRNSGYWLDLSKKPLAAGVGPGRYGLEPEAAREALRIWCAHTIDRPKRAPRLFVESYFMRALVQAHATLGASRDADWLDTRPGLDQAIAFADTLVATQDKFGFWPLGYKAVWYADMGAAVGLFATVEPYVSAARAGRYQAATARFIKRMEMDKMILPGGAVGTGQELIVIDGRNPRPSSQPYLVSTALVGIEAQAWLYRRTQRADLRQRAIAALDYTLSQIGPNGFRETAAQKEGQLRVSGYVEEGWIAADLLLDDPTVLARLRRALPPHVAWLLRMQRADGTWDAGAAGEAARTPAIVDFLMWYDQRCAPRRDVREAVRRAGGALIDPDRWPLSGLYRVGETNEVQRALSGRPLVALASQKYVF